MVGKKIKIKDILKLNIIDSLLILKNTLEFKPIFDDFMLQHLKDMLAIFDTFCSAEYNYGLVRECFTNIEGQTPTQHNFFVSKIYDDNFYFYENSCLFCLFFKYIAFWSCTRLAKSVTAVGACFNYEDCIKLLVDNKLEQTGIDSHYFLYENNIYQRKKETYKVEYDYIDAKRHQLLNKVVNNYIEKL
jgi:hypothetical protein